VTEHTRWNFWVIATECSAFQSGLAWVDPATVLPLFVTRLTGSTVLVGLVTVLQRLGYMLPQLPMAAILGHRPRRAPFLRWGVLWGRLPFIGFVIYLWARGVGEPGVVILLMMVAYLSVGLGNGVVAVPWQDIIAKSIPSFLRGRFFGAIHFATATAAIGVGFAVRWMLGSSGPGFPRSYTILFTLVAVFLAISTIGCWMVREPIRPVLDRPQSLREIVRGAVPLLRGRPAFRMLVVTGLLAFSMSYLMPFYMVYARRELGVQEAMAGVYILVMMVGTATFGLVWGQINDRWGPRSVIRGACGVVLLTPILALGLPAVGSAAPGAGQMLPGLFSLVFLCGGASYAGIWTGVTNYLFELTSHQDRPRYIALFNLFTLPGALVPLLIGLLLNYLPFPAVFSLMVACGGAALLLSWRLPHPTPLDSSTARE